MAEYLRSGPYREVEILVVNDGSLDRTFEVASDVGRSLTRGRLRVRVLDNKENRGKGYSVRQGVSRASGDWVLISDADLSAPIEECDKLVAAAVKNSVDVVIGSRALDRTLIGTHQFFLREVAGRIFNIAVRLVVGLPFSDTQCGFKLFSRKAADQIFSRQILEKFGFDVEALFLAQKLGFQVVEVPIRWSDVEGTKVGFLSGLDAFLDILRVRKNEWLRKYD